MGFIHVFEAKRSTSDLRANKNANGEYSVTHYITKAQVQTQNFLLGKGWPWGCIKFIFQMNKSRQRKYKVWIILSQHVSTSVGYLQAKNNNTNDIIVFTAFIHLYFVVLTNFKIYI